MWCCLSSSSNVTAFSRSGRLSAHVCPDVHLCLHGTRALAVDRCSMPTTAHISTAFALLRASPRLPFWLGHRGPYRLAIWFLKPRWLSKSHMACRTSLIFERHESAEASLYSQSHRRALRCLSPTPETSRKTDPSTQSSMLTAFPSVYLQQIKTKANTNRSKRRRSGTCMTRASPALRHLTQDNCPPSSCLQVRFMTVMMLSASNLKFQRKELASYHRSCFRPMVPVQW